MNESFLQLVRLGIGHSAESQPTAVNWSEIKTLAEKHGLSAVVLDGIEKASQDCQIPLNLKLQWIGEVLQEYEGRYKAYEKTIGEMAEFYNRHGFKMMILKGYACSLDWPKPEHRPCGDIDIWQFGKQNEADAALVSSFFAEQSGRAERKFHDPTFKIDKSHHHHTVFYWDDFMVENHYDFINIHRHYSHRGLEQIFKELGQDDSYYVEVKGEKVYLPSPNLHALFLVRHALNHFASIGINLRQVLDWAFFVEKHTNEIDWKWLTGMLEMFHMMDFYNCLNAICVDDLGFEASIFHGVQFNPDMKGKVLADILSPEYEVEAGVKNMLQRWKANRWKHQLCYKENVWAAFWYGVWSHLLKPKTIRTEGTGRCLAVM